MGWESLSLMSSISNINSFDIKQDCPVFVLKSKYSSKFSDIYSSHISIRFLCKIKRIILNIQSHKVFIIHPILNSLYKYNVYSWDSHVTVWLISLILLLEIYTGIISKITNLNSWRIQLIGMHLLSSLIICNIMIWIRD